MSSIEEGPKKYVWKAAAHTAFARAVSLKVSIEIAAILETIPYTWMIRLTNPAP